MPTLKLDLGITGRDQIKRALQVVKRDLRSFKRDVERSAKDTPVPGLGTERIRRREENRTLKGLADLGKAARKINDRVHREKLANIRKEERARIAAERKAARAAMKAEKQAAAERRKRVQGTLGTAGRVARRAAGIGVAGAGLLIGAGVRNTVRSEGAIADISNQAAGNIGEGRDRQEIFTDLKRLINSEAERTGLGKDQLAGGVRAGVAATGNLKQFENQMTFLSDLSQATAVDFQDLGAASGQVFLELNKTLGETEAAEQFQEIMKTIAGQAKNASIEIADLAGGMGGITSAAGQFEGDAKDLITTFGALAQLAKAGGAKSSAEAVTAVSKIPSDITKHIGQLENLGVKTKTKGGMALRDPMDILVDTLGATKGDLGQMVKLFGERSRKAFLPLQQAFKEATGGKTDKESIERGKKAARAKVTQLTSGVALSSSDVKEGAEHRRKQVDIQLAQTMSRLNTAFGEEFLPVLKRDIIPTVREELAPALAEAAPKMADMLTELIKLVSYLSDNPFGVVFAGMGVMASKSLVADLRSAGIGNAVSSAVSGQIGRSTIRGNIGKLSVGTASIAVAAATTLLVQQLEKLNDQTAAGRTGEHTTRKNSNALDFLPGFNEGEFSFDQLLGDVSNHANTLGNVVNPFGVVTNTAAGALTDGTSASEQTGLSFAREKFSLLGNVAEDLMTFNERLDKIAKEEATTAEMNREAAEKFSVSVDALPQAIRAGADITKRNDQSTER